MSKQTEALLLALEALEFNCVMSEDGEDLTPRKIKKAITALREALAEQPAPVPDETLLSFYQATDFPSLVSAMEGHIKKMQGKLQSNPQTAIDAWNNREMLRSTHGIKENNT